MLQARVEGYFDIWAEGFMLQACGTALLPYNRAAHMQPTTWIEEMKLRYEVQAQVTLAGIPGVGGTWGGDPTRLPPPPLYALPSRPFSFHPYLCLSQLPCPISATFRHLSAIIFPPISFRLPNSLSSQFQPAVRCDCASFILHPATGELGSKPSTSECPNLSSPVCLRAHVSVP